MTGQQKLCLPIRVSIGAAFALISVPLLVAVIGILYVRNANLARELAADAIDRTTEAVAAQIDELLLPLARVVEATATIGQIDRGSLRRPEAFRYFLQVLESTRQADSIYVGFARDGSFYQASRLPPDLAQFGPRGVKPPDNAHFAMRMLDASSGEKADSYFYLASWGDIVSIERGPALFDPRQRPWYTAAWANLGLSVSEPYIFFSSRQPGLTISQRIATDNGSAIGAVGADISLTALSKFLADQKVGAHGVVIIIDDRGHLVGYPQIDKIVARKGNGLSVVAAADVDDPRVAQAVKMRDAGAGEKFRAELAGATYIVSFKHLREGFNKDWSIGVITAEGDFVDPIRRTSAFMLALGSLVIALSILAIVWVSRLLTGPIKQIVAGTEQIREFNFANDFRVSSRIIEINQLASAVDAMQEGLRSFGAFVPKTLVRDIIASGRGTTVGGERRALTILFTDIQDFTRRSDAQLPETVLEDLSSYLDLMSRCIHEHDGTIDKFIGDAIMAFWNAPIADPAHAQKACRAALRCRAVNSQLNSALAVRGHAPMLTRFGLHIGETVVGNVGSADRMQYTALGAAVNVASRVEGLNKVYGTQLLVTDAVESAVRGEFLFRLIDKVVPAGTSQVIALFELRGTLDRGPDQASRQAVDGCAEWQRAIDLYAARDWLQAREAMENLAVRDPSDTVARIYVERCSRYAAAPPPVDWDGAQHFDTK